MLLSVPSSVSISFHWLSKSPCKESTRILASKTRVSPLKAQTVPRLELLAALILTRLVTTIRDTLSSLKTAQLVLWTDSMVVLCWLQSSKPCKQYVSSQINEIHRLTSKEAWSHCPGSLNPADMPSRGVKGSELLHNRTWWEGPRFLQLAETEWPCTASTDVTEEAQAEFMKNPAEVAYTLATSVFESSLDLVKVYNVIDCMQFSDLHRLLMVTAFMLRFIRRCRGSNESSFYHTQSLVEEIKSAERHWIKGIQHESFQAEIRYLKLDRAPKPLRVDQFGLFFDENQIVRCQGRLNNSSLQLGVKNTILLPYDHYYTELLISDVHKRLHHGGINDTLTTIRKEYWILKGRQAVIQVIRHCVTCKKMDGLAYPAVNPPDLPSTRVSHDPPFSNTGIDFAGPLYVNQATESIKAYVCLFTCASTCAVHLELVPNLNADSFLLAFRRFASRCGLPSTLLSDNAKTFKSACKEIHNIIGSREVSAHLTQHQVTWNFIVERAPWWGGFWERMVHLVKRCLRKAIGKSTLNYEQLNTVLVEVETIVNSRPLTYVYDDVEGVSYSISPSHLLYGRRIISLPNSEVFKVTSTHASLVKKSKQQRHALSQFLSLWRECT